MVAIEDAEEKALPLPFPGYHKIIQSQSEAKAVGYASHRRDEREEVRQLGHEHAADVTEHLNGTSSSLAAE